MPKRQDAKLQGYKQGIGSYDDRKGLGYGILEPKFQTPRQLQGVFPYIDDDIELDDDIDLPIDDDDIDLFVKMVNIGYNPVDYLDAASGDPFYFVAGNNKLKERAQGISTGLSPIPDLYKKRTASAGGGASPANFHPPGYHPSGRPTGSKIGWSKPVHVDVVEDDPVYELENLTSDDELTIKDLRKLIANIFYQQETEKEL
ncbi:MAG: hypothetical protein CME70_06190 [Halobacteriovorax sp.]|nr:hypothetical protein [Halobacteriovorax sp.]|tara:strand:- start:3792 stop:4394 length:603 start_codon:yes stop_codon:yes gene_type:complete